MQNPFHCDHDISLAEPHSMYTLTVPLKPKITVKKGGEGKAPVAPAVRSHSSFQLLTGSAFQ